MGTVLPEMAQAFERHKANEQIRQQQQGLGRPIVSFELGGQRIVAVGDTIYHSPKWKVFPDFLSDYMKIIIGGDWGNAELAKPFEERHPIVQWYDGYCHFQRSMGLGDGEIKSGPVTGVGACYLGLAYNLFLLKHNVELQERLIKRLKDRSNFQGAYYELIVAGTLIRAGYDLVLEDETDGATKHCEFSALSKATGKKYWVEAKMRGVAGVMGKTSNDGTAQADPTSELIKHLNQALDKPAADERIIFIDLNAEPHLLGDGQPPEWLERAAKKLENREKTLVGGQSAYVFVTNTSFHRALDKAATGHVIFAHGLGIPDFGKPGMKRVSESYREKKKHRDALGIAAAFRDITKFPSTFSGELPSDVHGGKSERIIIGETYFFDSIGEGGALGKVSDAVVMDAEKSIYLTVQANNAHHILKKPLTDAEFGDYKAHPEAYFGRIKHVSKQIDGPFEFFEFLMETHQHSTKEKLLEFMSGWPDTERLKTLSQEDVAIEYCERITSIEWQRRQMKKPA
jgi:hypothetical protein